jgi:pimeloyl-ACP methyl ester carboxylesterase
VSARPSPIEQGERWVPERPESGWWPGRTDRYGDVELHVRHTPQRADPPDTPGRRIVAVHGLAGSATNWTDLAGLLADRWATDAVDLPGFGCSPPPADGDLSVDGLTGAVTAFVEHVVATTRAPVHLLGNSLGGLLALQLAATRPELVATLTLVSPAMPHYRLRPGALTVPIVGAPLVSRVVNRGVGTLSAEQLVAASLRVCYAHPERVSPARVAQAAEETRRRETLPYAAAVTRATTAGLVRTFVDPRAARRAWQWARSVTAPTLLVAGLADRLVDPAVCARLAGRIPGSSVLTLPDVGHVAQMERPDLVAPAVREHLTRHGG